MNNRKKSHDQKDYYEKEGSIEEIAAIAHQKHHPRMRIAETLLKVNKIEVALDKLREENAANKIKRFYLKFSKDGLKRWMKASRLYERQASLSHQLEQSIDKKTKQTQAFNLELDQQASADTKALETMRMDYEKKIKEATAAAAWDNLGMLAVEAREAQQTLQNRQQQAMEAKIAASQKVMQQYEAEQGQLKQGLHQIALAKADKQLGLLQRVSPIAKLTTALHANEAQKALFLEEQEKLVTQLKEQVGSRHTPSKRRGSFFEPQEEKHAPILEQAHVEKFIKLVTNGQRDEAEALLKIEPLFALTYGKVVDNVDNLFKRITAFQYAVFVLDNDMWEMMFSHFTAEHCQLAYEQLIELEIQGTEYGKEKNWDKLTDEIKKYNDHYDSWNHEERVQQLKVIGKEQDKLAQHVVSEYNRPDKPFNPVPDFEDTAKLPRDENMERKWKKRAADSIWVKEAQTKPYQHAVPQKNKNMFSQIYLMAYDIAYDHILVDEKALLALACTRRQQKAQLSQRLKEKRLLQLARRKPR